jgi:putative sterol carrier protein
MSITVDQVFDEISKGLASDPSAAGKIGGIFHFIVGGKSWTVDAKNGSGSVQQGAPANADCTITIADNDFVQLMTGKVNGQNLFMQGKLKIKGNMGLAMKLDKIPKTPSSGSAAPSSSSSPAASSGSSGSSGFKAQQVFDELAKRINTDPNLVSSVGAIYQFDISKGGSTQTWTVDLKNGKGTVKKGTTDKPDCTLVVGDDDFVGMMTGKLNSQQLFMQGKLKIKGNMGLAMKLSKLQAPKAAL